MRHTLPSLNYEYNALAPVISEETMKTHHLKHHQAYVDNLNKALESNEELAGKSLKYLLQNIEMIDDAIKKSVSNNGGGHYNHSLFWQCMSPTAKEAPMGALGKAITDKYGSFDRFVEEFTTKALEIFGSGWVWLMPDLEITTTPNQDNPIMLGGKEPLLGLDVWEHAYYLDYKNVRAEYIKNWWKIVDWDFVEQRFSER